MTSSWYVMCEPELADYNPTVYGDSFNVASDSEGLYPCPVFNPDFPFHEGVFHGFMSSMYGTEEEAYGDGPTVEPYEQEKLACYNDWSWPSWLSECQIDNFFSPDDGVQDIWSGSISGKMEDCSHAEEQYENYISYEEGREIQTVCDYNLWGGNKREEDAHEYGQQGPGIMYGNISDDMGLYGSIFGYWPCLFRQMPKATW
ncbi:hypothetical protein CJ030_MR2G026917 [Morella rubra]|uniref:Uncharacterized protein n=1 Tax=Morella rubra TaxID=262757 RepID=A0A6A1WMC0_9ROSI|nr:hypothetical protein CJ030_MR2G026917 [Morella rubra]